MISLKTTSILVMSNLLMLTDKSLQNLIFCPFSHQTSTKFPFYPIFSHNKIHSKASHLNPFDPPVPANNDQKALVNHNFADKIPIFTTVSFSFNNRIFLSLFHRDLIVVCPWFTSNLPPPPKKTRRSTIHQKSKHTKNFSLLKKNPKILVSRFHFPKLFLNLSLFQQRKTSQKNVKMEIAHEKCRFFIVV
jgi:hypothetical protein